VGFLSWHYFLQLVLEPVRRSGGLGNVGGGSGPAFCGVFPGTGIVVFLRGLSVGPGGQGVFLNGSGVPREENGLTQSFHVASLPCLFL